MISQDKITFLMQLVLSSQEAAFSLEQALRLEDKEKIEQLKKELLNLNNEIKKTLIKMS